MIADIYDENTTGLKSIVSSKYDFIGNVLQTKEIHTTSVSTSDVILTSNTYDHRSRLKSTSTTVNNAVTTSMNYVYDELGRLSTKKYGNNIETESYAYNVRGWLTEKNSSKFNMKLRYNNPLIAGTTARYNGNITEWEWKQGATNSECYSFAYDPLSRLENTLQFSQNGSIWSKTDKFTESGLTYDCNGNIKTLKRNINSTLTDNLSYTYNGNQLTSLSGVSGSYLYDKNGNMTKDGRKSLELSYNSLNLLSEVKQGSSIKAKYVYASDGTKLGVKGIDGKGYYYRGSLIYSRNGSVASLESIGFSDGRIVKTSSGYDVNYQLTDHLGSVRVLFSQNGALVAQNDYYPFGGRHSNSQSTNSTSNRFKYNGKEEQTTGDIGFLDYGARMYDDYLGRWFAQDPAEQFNSPYNFCGNNPIVFVDPNGKFATIYEDEWGNELLNTKDGSNAIITVSDKQKGDFLKNLLWTLAAGGGMVDSQGWNRYWKEELTGLKWDNKLENWVNSLNSKNSIRYGIQYLQGIEGAGLKFLASEIGGQWTNPSILTSMASVYIGGVQAIEKGALKHYFKNTSYTKKVIDQIKLNDYHSFPESVSVFSKNGTLSRIKGGDGIYRQKLSIPGYYMGKDGNFEFIRELNGTINHRLFKAN